MNQKQQQLLKSVIPNRYAMGGEIAEKSRVCVKNLPKHLTLDRFKAHFSQIGDLTDALLLRTKEGRSRRMGFIGYRTEQQAQDAIKYFNNSFVDCSKITCEVGRKSADPNIPRPWSTYSKEKVKSAEKNIQFQEFLQVMQPYSKRKLWANDLEAFIYNQACTAREKLAQSNQQVWKKSIEMPNTDKSAHKEGDMHHENPSKSHKMACDPTVTDMDYFKSKIRKDWSDSESDTDKKFSQDDDSPARENQVQQIIHGNSDSEKQECLPKPGLCDELINLGNQSCHLEDADRLPQTCRIYVWNLPYAATEDEVAEFFNKFGKVKDVHLVIDKETRQPRGFSYVRYNSPEEAARALGDQFFKGGFYM
ncbi:multiple RNA-binding domain-containing protein 1-like isoform X3 [Beta vulgaris subsp. vulgaris]|uniref:multiple RNA-binding domain-containing protein 1-like isoform X3 n=1 Tax=Beta vulgaris subsp. vulgaris TaxID=3555 RepID=UPI0020370DE0|nr:multiple RNA-binding domain-containing protein 1-like isoform X3 [Beta vulgaris subsp. vulgaris]